MIEGTGNGDGTDLVVIDRRAGISWSNLNDNCADIGTVRQGRTLLGCFY